MIGVKQMKWHDLQRPALSGGDGKECEEGPENIVVMKLVLLPLSGLRFHSILVIVQKMTPETET